MLPLTRLLPLVGETREAISSKRANPCTPFFRTHVAAATAFATRYWRCFMTHVLLVDTPPIFPRLLFHFLEPNAVLEKSDEVMNSIDTAYLLENYRSIYEDPRFEVQLPVPEELTADTSMLPPLWVEGQAGRPSNASKASKGPARTKRIPSIGEKNASSSFNVRLPPSSGTTPTTATLSQGGGGGGLPQGAPALSQGGGGGGGLSQGAPALSQGGGGGGLPQGAPALSQGGGGGGGLSQGAPALSQGGGGGGLSQGSPALSQGAGGCAHPGVISIVD